MTKAAELGTLYNAARLLDKARAERDEAVEKLVCIHNALRGPIRLTHEETLRNIQAILDGRFPA